MATNVEPESEASKHKIWEQTVRFNIASNSTLTTPFIVMNGLATIVAAYGLLANSTAVVIGAMIIAMLLGPIMGIALAIVDGDFRLLRGALLAEAVGALMVVLIGVVLGRVHGDLPITAEILSRTAPNLLDLMIALAGGAAGAYATVSKRLSVGLVGVAISTALVPPLTSCGICLSRQMLPQASGAFILFLTNLVAIQVASSIVLYAFGFHQITVRQRNNPIYLRTLAADGALFLVLSIFLYVQLSKAIGEQTFQNRTKELLRRGMRDLPGAFLAETRFVRLGNKDIVIALVRVPNSITPQKTAELERLLEARPRHTIELHIRSQLTKETTREGYLHEIAPDSQPPDSIPQDFELPPETAPADRAHSDEGSNTVLPRGSTEAP